MSPKPPDILRKSHRHTDRKERAVARESLRDEAATAIAELSTEDGYSGSCACGALGYVYTTRVPPNAWPLRSCNCTFCAERAPVYTSDPAGRVDFRFDDPSALEAHRFDQQTADFLCCARCNAFVGAVARGDERSWAVLNVALLDELPDDLPAAQPVDHSGESREQRLRRHERRWTPVSRSSADALAELLGSD